MDCNWKDFIEKNKDCFIPKDKAKVLTEYANTPEYMRRFILKFKEVL
jgi:predicted SPOUT superfamily RNA methylase MTH1